MKPTIKVYAGRPVTGAEAKSVRRLHAELLQRGVDALLLVNFTAKDRQIDCVAVTAKQAALLDFKEITGAVRGGLMALGSFAAMAAWKYVIQEKILTLK